MKITLPNLAEDPALYLYAFDFAQGLAQIQPMDRMAFQRSIFLDGRIDRGKRQPVAAPINALLNGLSDGEANNRKLGIIFHVAQCGSTLLARALDHPGTSLSLREPYALRQLGIIGAEALAGKVSDPGIDRLLKFSLSMYGKHWPGEDTVVVKANVPVNIIADKVMAAIPDAPAIVLYFRLEDYAAAVMRTPGHRDWVERVFGELQLSDHPVVATQPIEGTATKVAALWFVQMQAFATILKKYEHVHSLDAAQFLAHPMPAVRKAAELFGVRPGDQAWDDLADSDLFTTYSKNPTLDYDPEVRIAREAMTKERIADEINEVFVWVEEVSRNNALPESLARPLVGEAQKLLARS